MPQKTRNSQLQKCMAAAFRFLKIRLRSIEELRRKLAQKGFPSSIIEPTLGQLIDMAYLDDALFARQWVVSRLKKPYGPKRIKQELIQKGVSKDNIERELTRALYYFSQEDIVTELARKRTEKYKNINEKKRKQRLYAYLTRRGFDAALIYKAVQNI